ncbi:MAG: PilZ domain-containing protein [Myxococcales bacterium]|nr:PilZ domain-containing protein [Myxococcales bacterium]
MSDQGPADTPAQAKYPFHKRFVRKPVEIRVEVERFQEALNSSSVNISPSGMCFKIGEPLELEEQMKILLYVPRGKEVEILKVQARVGWQEPHEDTFRVGAAFEKFAPGDERRLRLWLLELGGKKDANA